MRALRFGLIGTVIIAASTAVFGQTPCEARRVAIPQLLEQLGHAVDVDGRWAVVGAPGAGSQGPNTGAARFFHFENGAWIPRNAVLASDATADVGFGHSVAIDGTWAVIGTGFNSGLPTGAAYVFEFDGTDWVEKRKVVGSDATALFGYTVDIDGDRIIVGDPGDSRFGNQAGAAYIFRREGAAFPTFVEEKKLLGGLVDEDDNFGLGVALSGDWAVVGAPGHAFDAGFAYAFQYTGSTWIQNNKFEPADLVPSDYFGVAVDIDDTRVVIGSPNDNAPAGDSGSVYVFLRSGFTFSQEAKLAYSAQNSGDLLGGSMQLEGTRLVVGMVGWDACGPADPSCNSGGALLLERSGTTWSETGLLVTANAAAGDLMGRSVALGGPAAAPFAISGDPVQEIVYSFAIAGDDCDGDGTFDMCQITLVYPYSDDNDDVVLDACEDRDLDAQAPHEGDCDDTNGVIYSGAPQLCDGLNNDCLEPTWPAIAPDEADSDMDGLMECAGDCDDFDEDIYPGAPELCDGKNNDCTHPAWPMVDPLETDDDGDAYRECEGDCDDVEPLVWPGAPAGCDGVNNNCGDPGWPGLADTEEGDDDGDGFSECQLDCDDTNAAVFPGSGSQCQEIWEKQLQAAGTLIRDVAITSDGGLLLAGEIAGDGWVARLDSSGTILWEQRYRYGTALLEFVLELSVGEVIAGGFSAGDYPWLLRLDAASGEILAQWQNVASGNPSRLFGALELPSGDIAAIWANDTAPDTNSAAAMIIDPVTMTTNLTIGYGLTRFNDLEVTPDGDLIIAGVWKPSGGATVSYLGRLDPALPAQNYREWERVVVDSPLDSGFAQIGLTSDGGIVGIVSPMSSDDLWMLKVDSTGLALWQQMLDAPGDLTPLDMEVAADDTILLVGNLQVDSPSPPAIDTLWVARFDAGGVPLREQRLGHGTEWLHAGIGAHGGGALSVAATGDSGNPTDSLGLVARLDADGWGATQSCLALNEMTHSVVSPTSFTVYTPTVSNHRNESSIDIPSFTTLVASAVSEIDYCGCADNDADSVDSCADCDDADPTIYPGAPEINDGQDNNCPGDAGFGQADEVGMITVDASEVCWTDQPGTTSYELVSSDDPQFLGGCTFYMVGVTCFTDPVPIAPNEERYYLVRSLMPFAGSWGVDSMGIERQVSCGGGP